MNQKIALPALLACCTLATCTDEPSVTLTPVEEWTTEPHYEIGDQMEGDALFARITGVVPTADGSRVYVLDRQAFEVTIWTPDGTLIGRVGRAGDGPGDFASPGSLFLFDDGFQVAEGLRITTFSLDGDLVRADGLERAMNPSGDPRKRDDGQIRRIIVPESFSPLDANDTHVWGVRTDEMGVQYVAGLRLVRAS